MCLQRGLDCVRKVTQAPTVRCRACVDAHSKCERPLAPPVPSLSSLDRPVSPSFSTGPGISFEQTPAPPSSSHSPQLKRKERIRTPPTIGPSFPYFQQPPEEPPFTRQKSFSSMSSRFPSTDSRYPPLSSSPQFSTNSAFDSEDKYTIDRMKLRLDSATSQLELSRSAHRQEQSIWASQAKNYEEEIASLRAEVSHLRARIARVNRGGEGGAGI
jgi:hypothetical protein